MPHSETSVRNAYGLAFEIEDLVLLRSWAEQRHLRLIIALDRTLDGAEFEEMLFLTPRHAKRKTLTLWRTQDGIFAQTANGAPRGFATLGELLGDIRPARTGRTGLLRRWGLVS